jgi:hypothetical protein
LIEDGGSRFHNLLPGLFAFGHTLAPDLRSETDSVSLHNSAPVAWMPIET